MRKVTNQAIDQLIAPFSAEVKDLTRRVRALARSVVPDASEEADPAAKLLGLTFIPGTYQGLTLSGIPGLAAARAHGRRWALSG